MLNFQLPPFFHKDDNPINIKTTNIKTHQYKNLALSLPALAKAGGASVGKAQRLCDNPPPPGRVTTWQTVDMSHL
ncbi:hypothetical protein [Halomonas dongshanensis]|uniref:Uncharacterized protein n=1 Tax=Halomonas dongshanensis TaxID=2890835 RepID=A0ABT2EC14_9GAMM|nr:hypothetical protein [Halomonas dongshanensis]MCS2609118.1 hypothetical protein [Halomonas dongshanensis]